MKLCRKSPFKNHRGVLDAGIIILGGIVTIIAIIAATLAWSDILEVSFEQLMIAMPQFEYDVKLGQETGNKNFEIYQMLRNIALLILVFVMVFAGISLAFEHVNWVQPDTAYQILSKSILYVFFFFFFPPLWDLIATSIEEISLWILNPTNQEHQTANVEFLLTKLGAIESPEFTLDAVVAGISDPLGSLKNIFLGTFLSAFKAISFLIFMFLTFLIGTIRMVLTTIITVALPVILMLSLIPFFGRVTRRFFDAFVGLMLAPIFSALVIIVGVAHLQTIDANNPDPLVEWFASLAVMALAAYMPVILAPLLGSVLNSVSSVVSNAMTTGAILTRYAGIGAMSGIASLTGRDYPGDIGRINTNPLIFARSVSSNSKYLPMPQVNLEPNVQTTLAESNWHFSNQRQNKSDVSSDTMDLSGADIRNSHEEDHQ